MSIKRKFLIFPVICIILLSCFSAWGKTVPPEKNKDLYYRLQGELVCLCGCGGLLIKDCFCGNADKMRDFLSIQINAGKTEAEIRAALVSIHGEKVLAEPISPTAKIIIAVALALLTLFVIVVLIGWRKNRRKMHGGEIGDDSEQVSEAEIEYDSRIDEALKDMDS